MVMSRHIDAANKHLCRGATPNDAVQRPVGGRGGIFAQRKRLATPCKSCAALWTRAMASRERHCVPLRPLFVHLAPLPVSRRSVLGIKSPKHARRWRLGALWIIVGIDAVADAARLGGVAKPAMRSGSVRRAVLRQASCLAMKAFISGKHCSALCRSLNCAFERTRLCSAYCVL